MRASVLFVCLGNICRSPLAEAAFRYEAEKVRLSVHIDSAGTGAWHVGKPPDPRARALARAKASPRSSSSSATAEDYRRFTHIFALGEDKLATLLARAPADATAEVALLLDCVPGREGQPVADPYYGDESGFEATWRDVSEAARALARRLLEP